MDLANWRSDTDLITFRKNVKAGVTDSQYAGLIGWAITNFSLTWQQFRYQS